MILMPLLTRMKTLFFLRHIKEWMILAVEICTIVCAGMAAGSQRYISERKSILQHSIIHPLFPVTKSIFSFQAKGYRLFFRFRNQKLRHKSEKFSAPAETEMMISTS